MNLWLVLWTRISLNLAQWTEKISWTLLTTWTGYMMNPDEESSDRLNLEDELSDRMSLITRKSVNRDTGDFRQFHSVACREFTLRRDDPASQPKGWIRGNMRIGLVLEVTTSFRHFKYGIEIRIQSVNQDDSHSWVRIYYGTVKYVNDSIEDNTENLADSQEEESVPTSSRVVAAMSKAKAKPQPRELVGTTTTIPIHQRRWIVIEPSKQDLESYDLSKKVVNLLRRNQKLHREEDGAIQFYKIIPFTRPFSNTELVR